MTACVKALLQCHRPDFEIIVRDNCSDDDTLVSLQQINDPRFKLLTAPENQGTLNFFLASQAATGDIVTWLSDEDSFKFEHFDFIFDTFAKFPDCDAFMGSIIVGRRNSVVHFKDAMVEDKGQAFLDTVRFSGCGGVFIRRSTLVSNVHQFFQKLSQEDAYALWNFYPMGFFASRCVGRKLVKTSRVVVEQTRFGQTTNNWSKNTASGFAQRPHYWPDSVFDRLVSNIVNVFFKKLPLAIKWLVAARLVYSFSGQRSSFSNPDMHDLLRENYSEETVRNFLDHIERLKLNDTTGRYIWVMKRIVFSLPIRLYQTMKYWRQLT